MACIVVPKGNCGADVLSVIVLRAGAGFLVLCAGAGVLVLLRLGKCIRGARGGGGARGA